MLWNVLIVVFLDRCATGEKFYSVTVINWYLKIIMERTDYWRSDWKHDFLCTSPTLTTLRDWRHRSIVL